VPTSHRLPLLCLILVILVGSGVRLAGLGDAELWTDELNHHFAAQAIASGQGPVLPSGETYQRGLFISRAIAVSQRYFDDPELAARLPSAAMGFLNLVLMGLVAWLIAGPWPAVWATVLMTIYPEAVFQSRTARFYTTQINFGLVALLAGWYATRGNPGGMAPTVRRTVGDWGWMVVAAGALLCAYRIHPTTLPVVLALSIWIAAVAISDLHRGGRTALQHSMALQVLVVGVLGGAILLAAGVAGPTLAGWWRRAQYTASWLGYESGPWQYYYWKLSDTFPWIVSLLPILVIVALRKAPRLTLYLLAWFLVPLLIHSTLLAWKGARQFLLPLPALFIIVGIGTSQTLAFMWQTADRTALAITGRPGWRLAGRAALVLGTLWAIYTLPAFGSFRQIRNRVDDARGWPVTAEILAARPALAGLPWGSVDPLMSLYQWGRVDFGVQSALTDYAVPPAPHHPVPRFPPAGPPAPHDFYTGVPLAITPDAIRGAYGHYGTVIIGVYVDSPTLVSPQLSEILSREAEELCNARCGRLRLYLWRFQPDSSAANVPE
jgi:4-amino-4-deoxy-L-arabinose transferase-like glycosyltransferase